jgi:hypothetical protein
MLSLAVIWLTIYPISKSDKIISSILAFLWLWMGIVYHLIFFSKINKAAYLFGFVFILQGIIFLYFGVFQNKLCFQFRSARYGLTGIFLVIFALIGYPFLGYFLGHHYPSSPTFGLPCPTTIFSFGILLLTNKKFPILILAIPFLWSIVGFLAAINFGMIEDSGLLISALLSTVLLQFRNKMLSKKLN